MVRWRTVRWPLRSCSMLGCCTSFSARGAKRKRPSPAPEPIMYIYDEIDQKLVDERVVQFRDQTRRFLAGKLSEDEFRALRLRNGLYIQRYAPMLRIAIPYGLLSTKHVATLSPITNTYDSGQRH